MYEYEFFNLQSKLNDLRIHNTISLLKEMHIMARKCRKIGKSGIYHIIIRGNDQQNIFIDQSDRRLMLKRINQYSSQLNLTVFTYCLMTNHVHILVGNANSSISKFMQKLTTSYARCFNLKYERSGHLFQGRFLSKPIETDENFKTVFRYVLQNPQKAGLNTGKNRLWTNFQDLHKNHNVISMFDNIQLLFKFLHTENNDICMEFNENKRISDSHCARIIIDIVNIDSPRELKKIEKQNLLRILKKLKTSGLSQNQIARVTGINRKLIRYA